MRRILLFVASLVFLGLSAWAEGAPVDMAAMEDRGDQAASKAPVGLDGQTLFHVAGTLSYPAENARRTF